MIKIKPTPKWLLKAMSRARKSEAYEVEGHVIFVTEDILQKMIATNVTRSDLARRLKVSPAYITKFFRGQNMTIETMVKITRALGVKLSIDISL